MNPGDMGGLAEKRECGAHLSSRAGRPLERPRISPGERAEKLPGNLSHRPCLRVFHLRCQNFGFLSFDLLRRRDREHLREQPDRVVLPRDQVRHVDLGSLADQRSRLIEGEEKRGRDLTIDGLRPAGTPYPRPVQKPIDLGIRSFQRGGRGSRRACLEHMPAA